MNRKEQKDVPPKHISEKIEIKKIIPDANFPRRDEGRDSDVGMNIELIGRTKNRSDDVFGDINEFRTGLGITPPDGHYIEIHAADDLHLNGYMLASGVKIINPGSTEEVIVPLYKFKDVEDLELPFIGVKIIVKPAVYAHPKSVKSMPSRTDMEFAGTPFEGYGMGPGMYIQNPGSAAYAGDMGAYQQQVSAYGKGTRRPVAAPPRSNHMF